MIAIDTISIENEVASNMYERSDIDYPIYNTPSEYADLILKKPTESNLRELLPNTKCLTNLIRLSQIQYFVETNVIFAYMIKKITNLSYNIILCSYAYKHFTQGW